jgi:hypothetical protein
MERDPEHTHPAQPDTPDSGFAEGVDHKPDTPDEELESDFARGLREGPEAELEDRGRFSEGIEEFPDSPEKRVEGDFATGIEGGPPDTHDDD